MRKSIYEYGNELYCEYIENLPYKEYTIKQYYGNYHDLEEFIDLLDLIADYEQVNWKVYSDKEDIDFVYVEVWDKHRDLTYKENIREEIDIDSIYSNPIMAELHHDLDSLMLQKRIHGNADFSKFMKKFNKLK